MIIDTHFCGLCHWAQDMFKYTVEHRSHSLGGNMNDSHNHIALIYARMIFTTCDDASMQEVIARWKSKFSVSEFSLWIVSHRCFQSVENSMMGSLVTTFDQSEREHTIAAIPYHLERLIREQKDKPNSDSE